MLVQFEIPTRILAGSGAHAEAPSELHRLGANRVLVVTDPGIVKSGLLDLVAGVLDRAQLPYTVFDRVRPQPTCGGVQEAYALYRAQGCDALLAVGGGSSMDTAKGVAILATNGGRPQDYSGFDKFANQPAPMIAVPTTAGTGSEVSAVASLVDEETGAKLSLRHSRYNRARVAILDPMMVKTLPRHQAIITGLDALAHNVEAYTSKESNSFSDAISAQGIALIGRHLRSFVEDRGNQEAAEAMQAASTLGGIALSAAGTGNSHCIARFLAAEHHMEHGMACAVTLPWVVGFNHESNPAKFAYVARALGESGEGLSDCQLAARASTAVRQLCDDLSISRSLGVFGVNEAHVPHLAEASFNSGYNRWNPRYTSVEGFAELIGAMVKEG